MRYDCVVIGSGVSGLCSALILARHGRKVALVEQNRRLAPLLSRFARRGFRFDTGFHYCGGLHEDGPYRVLFRSMGLGRLFEEAVPMDSQGYDAISWEDGKVLRIPTGLENVREAFRETFPDSAKAVAAYIARIRAIYRETPFANLDQDPEHHDLRSHVRTSLGEVLREAGAGEDMRRALDLYNFYLCGLRADETSMHLHAMVVGSFYHAAHTFQRGGDSFADAFARHLSNEGVDVFTGCAASGFEVDERRRLRGVRVRDGDESVLECDACICTVHPKTLVSLLTSAQVRKGYLSRLQALEETFSPFAVYLGMEKVPSALENSNRYHLPGDPGGQGIGRPFAALACDPTDYGFGRKGLCLLDKAWEGDDSGGCGGANGGFCRKKGDVENGAYEDYKKRAAETLLENFLEAFPQLRGHCSILSVAAPCTYESHTGVFGGSIYGVKHSVRQAGLNTGTPIGNLFLAGQSIIAPGVMGAAISAFIAAARILGWKKVWSEVQKWR